MLRFNFRGVGRSQGSFDRGEGELSDAASALDWLQGYNAWIGMQLLMRRPEITSFVSVSPPANQYDFTFLAPCPSSGLVIHGGDDKVVPEASVAKLIAKLTNQRDIKIDYRIVPGTDHFFHDRQDDLTTHLDDYLGKSMGQGAKKTAVR